MLILENSTKTGLKHRVIRKVQSLNFAQKNLFDKRTKRRQLNSSPRRRIIEKMQTVKCHAMQGLKGTIFFL